MFIQSLITYFTILLFSFNFIGSSSNISTDSPVQNVVIGDVVTPGNFTEISGKIISFDNSSPSILDGTLISMKRINGFSKI